MNAPENPTPSAPATDAQTVAEMRNAIESLRGVFQVVCLSGIVLSGTVLAFLYKEVSVVKRQNDELTAYIVEYNTNVAPKIEMARSNLLIFARTNPTIVPILKKYFPTNTPVAAPTKP
jgi:hypothetical protein